MIFFHRILVGLLEIIPLNSKAADRATIDTRLLLISTSGCMRDPRSRRSYRVQKTLFSEANLSAADRVCILFYIPHVLGYQARVLPENIRQPMLQAVATAQQMLIALFHRRPYTQQELTQIFDQGYITFFKCCEKLYVHSKTITDAKRQRKHERNPEKYSAPKRHKRKSSTWKHAAPVSSTDDTDEEHNTGGLGKYSHGHVCLSHQHWVRQVISSGCFGVHCTQAPEACHKISMQLASARVRHVSANTTRNNMLQYVYRHHLFEELRLNHFQSPPGREGPPPIRESFGVPLIDFCTGQRVTLGSDMRPAATQGLFLHPEARIARVELLDLVCEKFSLPKTISSYQVIQYIC